MISLFLCLCVYTNVFDCAYAKKYFHELNGELSYSDITFNLEQLERYITEAYKTIEVQLVWPLSEHVNRPLGDTSRRIPRHCEETQAPGFQRKKKASPGEPFTGMKEDSLRLETLICSHGRNQETGHQSSMCLLAVEISTADTGLLKYFHHP